ncbi:ribonuclease H-like domain-containing protein [Tanacetum coccineum]
MYSVDIKNIVPKESLNCLVTKATLDESMLWHWRLGHVNFKTINKLVKENLVRGLPLKIKRFENDQTCVACLKGKQHKASCKSKIHNSITQPLFMSHIDLFGLTFVSSLMNKKYCLVVTDDYSRFTWVFFLASKDETSGILKSFITEIENLVDKKVKIIRCDNGTEFKNRVMSDFCEKKGIKREFSVSVTILNTLELYGKFDRKSHEGFFVEYSLNSKAFRVYNIRTRKVEESLHIRFLEDKPIIAGYGPKLAIDIEDLPRLHFDANWKDGSLFDSSLKNASNDEPQPSSDAGKKDDEGVCKESGIADQEKSKNSTQGVNTAGPRDWTKTTNEQGFISAVYEGKTHEDLHTCLFACFLSQEEPKKSIGTKWVYKNKKDERGIVIRNKARLVAQGYTQEEGIDYDEFPDRVYKVEKALYGLHQAPRAWYETLSTYLLDNGFQRGLQVTQKDDGIFISQDKYVDEILKKFGFLTLKTASTPMETSKPLLKDAEAEDVDVHLYKSMIGSLKYLTASRPDIMFAVLSTTLNWAIKYPKDSPFDLKAYTDSDYAGASLDRKSITAEYVVAASCCRQVLWIQNQMADYGYNIMNTKIFHDNESTICIVKNPVFHSKTKHIEIRHHFIRDSNENKLIQMIKIHTDQNVADLLTKAFDVSRFQYLIASIGMLNL